MKVIPWSQIQDTELGRMARLVVWDNADNRELTYHNWDHVHSMYQYLADTNEPYDEVLDWAILFHDIVYDEKPEKELRSAKVFVDMVKRYEGCGLSPAEQGRVYSLVMRTVDHVVVSEVKGSSAIIRADLHGLTKRLTSIENFVKIMKESMSLYNIDEVEFAKNSEKFMTDLMFRVHSNIELDPNHADFYLKVGEGIYLTITLARMIRGNTQ